MASRTMHLAIVNNLNKSNLINDIKRYEIGQILPDAITHGLANHDDSHFKATVCNGKMKMIDFASFYNEFNNEILSDELYLGYYFHLVQDGIYRKFLSSDHTYNGISQEDIEVLHNDYRLLNTYLISKYYLENNLLLPDGFEKEKINGVYKFSINKLLEDTKNDFLPYHNGKTKKFTEEMADKYIEICSELCKKELESLKEGHSCLNPMDYAWEIPVNR